MCRSPRSLPMLFPPSGCNSVDESSENPSASGQLLGVTMENMFHVLWGFLFFPSALLAKPFAHFHPPQLNLTEGETAKFTCSISNPDFGRHLNWYKQGHDRQPVKLDVSNQKYSFSNGDKCIYEMEIRQVEKNDSGTYYCWVNPFHSEGTMLESNRGNLTVTEKAIATQPPGRSTLVKEQDDGDRKDAKSSFSDVRGSGLLILLIVLYFLLWIIRRRRRKQKEQKHGNAPLEEVIEPPAVTVFTVDYEMLAFPGGPKVKLAASPKPAQREPTEYATIVFLPKTLDDAEASCDDPKGRGTKAT